MGAQQEQLLQEMLHKKGYTIAGAKTRIAADHRKRLETVEPQMDLDFLPPRERRQLRLIRTELAQLRDWLQKRGDPLARWPLPPPAEVSADSWAGEISVEPPLGEG